MAEKKSRAKYRKGGPILSLDELARQEFVFFMGKIYHHGWFASWQLRWCQVRIQRGEILYAIGDDENEGT